MFVQEHWLPSFNLDSLYNYSDAMLCYASSAMEEVISAKVLRCRPFGRVAIFVKTSLCAGVKLICKNSRFIITQLGDLILVNVYLPCPGANNWDNEYVNCLALIANKLCELDYKNLIFGGNLNTDFARFHPMRSSIMDFFSDLGLRLTATV